MIPRRRRIAVAFYAEAGHPRAARGSSPPAHQPHPPRRDTCEPFHARSGPLAARARPTADYRIVLPGADDGPLAAAATAQRRLGAPEVVIVNALHGRAPLAGAGPVETDPFSDPAGTRSG
jgi:hypothetical protein